jgi:hypothetical protein
MCTGPAARIFLLRPDATDGAICVTRREAWVTGFDCGAGAALLSGVTPRSGGRVSTSVSALGSSPLPFRAVPTEGREGSQTMTRTEHDLAARRQGELARDRGSRRLSSAVDAQRRLNGRRADGDRTKADSFGPSDPSYTHLTRAHD